MSSDPTHDARPLPPVQIGADTPEVYSAYGLATHFGEVIGMLRFRFRDDSWRAYPYYGLTGLHYDPAVGIELTFVTATVMVRGRNLFTLFTLLGDHAVRWVWEADRTNWLLTPEQATVVERIEVGAGRRGAVSTAVP